MMTLRRRILRSWRLILSTLEVCFIATCIAMIIGLLMSGLSIWWGIQ